jgi:hypothetical protein
MSLEQHARQLIEELVLANTNDIVTFGEFLEYFPQRYRCVSNVVMVRRMSYDVVHHSGVTHAHACAYQRVKEVQRRYHSVCSGFVVIRYCSS